MEYHISAPQPDRVISATDILPDQTDNCSKAFERLQAIYLTPQAIRKDILTPMPALHAKGSLYKTTLEVCATEYDDFSQLDVYADQVLRQINRKRNQTSHERIISYIRAYSGLTAIATNELRPQHIVVGQNINIITDVLAYKLVQGIDSPEELFQIATMSETLGRTAASMNLVKHGAKFAVLTDKATERATSIHYLEALAGLSDQDMLDAANHTEDSEIISALFEDSLSSRAYGVKPAYINDSRGGSLVFDEPAAPYDVAGGKTTYISPLMLDVHAVAEVIHNSEQDPREPNWSQETLYQAGDSGYSIRQFSGLSPLKMFKLGADGELYHDSQCRRPLKEIALRSDATYTAYRNLQLDVISHFHDLTHQISEQGDVQRTLTAQSLQAFPREAGSQRDATGKLVVPRLVTERSQEAERDDQEDEAPRRSVRKHDVVWHIRRLPEGWKASPRAYALAQDLGITLDANETIVKEHSRGNEKLGRVAIHSIVTLNA